MALIQFHVLCDYGPNVLNRDDAGEPKSVTIGGVPRQRISSQCLKNALRSSLALQPELAGRFGMRTRRLGHEIEQHLLRVSIDPTTAAAVARDVAEHYGAMQPAGLQSTTLTFLSPAELQAAKSIAVDVAKGKRVRPVVADANTTAAPGSDPDVAPKDGRGKRGKGKRGKGKGNKSDEFKAWLPLDQLLLKTDTAVDISLFGRMLSNHKKYEFEAASRFTHAFTTHRASIDADYFTGQDHQIQDSVTDTGAGHLDVQMFGAGVFYHWAMVDTDQLIENLGGDVTLAMNTTLGLAYGLTKITPPAKRNGFAADAYASYVLVEAGYDVASCLSGAFTVPVRGPDYVGQSIAALRTYRDNLAAAEGKWGKLSYERIATPTETAGTTAEMLERCADAFRLSRPTEPSLVARAVAKAVEKMAAEKTAGEEMLA